MNTITEEQYRQLKKYAFLFIGDEKQADEIVQKTISKCARKILEVPDKEVEGILRNELIYQCRLYTKRFDYKKDSLLKTLGIKWYDSPFSGWRSINKLPTAAREVIIGHYIWKLTTAQLAKAFQLPPGHVTGYINQTKKKLNIINDIDEELFLQNLMLDLQFIEKENWVNNATFTPIIPEKSKKKRYALIGSAALLLLAGGIFLFANKENAKNIMEVSNPSETDEAVIEGETNQPNSLVIPMPVKPIQLDELTIKLKVHELFYYNSSFYTAKQAKKIAVEELYRNLFTIQFANERNIFLSDQEIEYHIETTKRQLSYREEEHRKYMETVLDEFQITEEQYIHSIAEMNLVHKYYEKLYDMEVNMDELYNGYYELNIPEKYYVMAGITLKEVQEVNEEMNNYIYQEVTERQFDLAFDLTGSYLHVVQLENGEYRFENPMLIGLYGTKYESFLDNHLSIKFGYHITRTNLYDLIDYLENIDTDYEQYKEQAKELVEVYKLLAKSIEWELE